MSTTSTVATTTTSLKKYFVFLTKAQSASVAGSTLMPQLILNEGQKQCGHVFTTYIVPSLMHFVSFVIGFIYFRINENEQLYSLMEKVFLAVNQTLKTVSQDRVIRRLRLFILLGSLWILLAMILQIFYRFAFGFQHDIYLMFGIFIVIQASGLIIMNSIYLAITINHSTQCELIIFYINEVQTRLEEKSISLRDAMQVKNKLLNC